MTDFFEGLKKMYKKETYLDKYGGSVVSTGFILFIFFLIFSYFYIQINIKPIKANWNKERCQPYIIPFAGFINSDPKMSTLEFTQYNFTQCTNTIFTQIAGIFLKPIYYSMNLMSKTFKRLGDSVQNIRKFVNFIRTKIKSISTIIMTRILNVLMPLRFSMIKLKAIIGKTQGILSASLFTVFGTFLTMKSFLGAFIQLVIIMLIVLAASIAILWILPFTWPAAAAATTFFLAISIPLGMVVSHLEHTIHISEQVPGKPSCFDENTIIKTKTGNKKISKLTTADVLEDNTTITATMKLSSKNVDMYNFRNIIVSGNHRVISNKEMVYIKDHPDSIHIKKYKNPYIYCLNTNTKTIKINNEVFLDWDDMTFEENDLINKNITIQSKIKLTNYDYLNGGFVEMSKVQMADGTTKDIKNVKIGDEVANGDKVYGLVTIKELPIKNVIIDGKQISGGPNLQYELPYLGKNTTLNLSYEFVENKKPLYHLLTEKDNFIINGIKFFDYNGCLDIFLTEPQKYIFI